MVTVKSSRAAVSEFTVLLLFVTPLGKEVKSTKVHIEHCIDEGLGMFPKGGVFSITLV